MKNVTTDFETSRLVRLLFCCLFAIFFQSNQTAKAATITSNTSGGNWSSTSTWSGGSLPSSTDDVFINVTSGNSVTVDGNYTCAKCSIVNNIAGALTVSSGNTLTITSTLTSTTANPTSDLIYGTGTIKMTGTGSLFGTYWGATATFSNLIIDPTTTTTINKAIGIDGGTLTINSGTVSCSGVISGINSAILNVASGATLNTSAGIYGSSANTTYYPTINISGILITSSYLNSTTFTLNTGATFRTTYTGGAQGWWYSSYAPTTVNLNGTVDYNSGAQKVAAYTYNNIYLNGSSNATKTLNGNITIDGTFKIGGYVGLVMSSNTISYGSSATLEYAGTNTQSFDVSKELSSTPHNIIISNSNSSGVTNSSSNVTISGDLTVTNSLFETTKFVNCRNLTITGSKLIVDAGCGLTTSGTTSITNSADSLILKSSFLSSPILPQSATFIHNGSISGSGTVKVECKYSGHDSSGDGTGTPDGRYWYLSPPMSLSTSDYLTWDGSKYDNVLKIWDNATGKWKVKTSSSASNFETLQGKGVGFILRPVADQTKYLSGQPYEGDIAVTVNYPSAGSTQGFKLVGNPYTSYLDMDALYSTFTGLELTIYQKTYSDITSSSGGVMQEVTCQLEGGAVCTGGPDGITYDKYIAPMQSFWVRASTQGVSGSLTFQNSQRAISGSSANFLKSSSLVKTTKESIELALYTGKIRDTELFRFLPNATNQYDKYDSEKMYSEESAYARLFTKSPEGRSLVIDSRSIDTATHILPINLTITQKGTFTFKANVSNLSSYAYVWLKDSVTNKYTNLKENLSYTFDSDTTSKVGRFTLYVSKNPVDTTTKKSIIDTTGNKTTDKLQTTQVNIPLVYASSGKLHIENCAIGTEVYVLDMLGRQVLYKKTSANPEIITLKGNTYVVKLVNSKVQITRKIAIPFEN